MLSHPVIYSLLSGIMEECIHGPREPIVIEDLDTFDCVPIATIQKKGTIIYAAISRTVTILNG